LEESSDSSFDYEVYSGESDPEGDYEPESEEERPVQRPRKVKKTRSYKKVAPKRRKTRQCIRTMTKQERQDIIGSYEDVENKEMDTVD